MRRLADREAGHLWEDRRSWWDRRKGPFDRRSGIMIPPSAPDSPYLGAERRDWLVVDRRVRG